MTVAAVKCPTVTVSPVAVITVIRSADGRFASVIIRGRRGGNHRLGSNKWFAPSHDRYHRVCGAKQHCLARDFFQVIGRLEIKSHVGDHGRCFSAIRLFHKRRQIIRPDEQQEGLPDDHFGINVENYLT